MPKAVFSYSFIQLYYLPYIRLKPELPEQERRAELRIDSFTYYLTYCLPSFRLLEPLALTFILRPLHNKTFY